MAWRDLDETDLSTLRQLDEKQIKLLYHLSWWDGPLTGVVEYQGREAWFQFAGEDAKGEHYRHVLYPLTDEHLDKLDQWCDKRTAWATEHMPWEGEEEHQAAKEAWAQAGLDWTGPDLTEVQPIGWFMDGANQSFYAIDVQHGQTGQEETAKAEAGH